jgi:hypothetical protein
MPPTSSGYKYVDPEDGGNAFPESSTTESRSTRFQRKTKINSSDESQWKLKTLMLFFSLFIKSVATLNFKPLYYVTLLLFFPACLHSRNVGVTYS